MKETSPTGTRREKPSRIIFKYLAPACKSINSHEIACCYLYSYTHTQKKKWVELIPQSHKTAGPPRDSKPHTHMEKEGGREGWIRYQPRTPGPLCYFSGVQGGDARLVDTKARSCSWQTPRSSVFIYQHTAELAPHEYHQPIASHVSVSNQLKCMCPVYTNKCHCTDIIKATVLCKIVYPHPGNGKQQNKNLCLARDLFTKQCDATWQYYCNQGLAQNFTNNCYPIYFQGS